MGLTAENVSKKYKINRMQEGFCIRKSQKASNAMKKDIWMKLLNKN